MCYLRVRSLANLVNVNHLLNLVPANILFKQNLNFI